MKNLWYITIFIILGLLFYLIFLNNVNDRQFQFTYNVDLESSNTQVEVWIPIPQSNEVQTVIELSFSHNGMECEKEIEAQHNNKYYYCYAEKLNDPTTLSLIWDITRKEHGTIKYSNVNPDNYDKGTNNRTVLEGDIFNKIIEENNLKNDNIREIYNYVLSGMHYGKPKSISQDDPYYAGKNPKTGKEWLPKNEDYGRKKVSKDDVVSTYIKSKNDKTLKEYTFGNGNSIYACDIGVGNCTDYHSYFMSLCRTLDIPVRFHMGFSIPNKEGKEEGVVEGYHCWADYYREKDGWGPVDISEADKDPNKKDYFFGRVNKNRVEFTVGRDFILKNRSEPQNFFVYPIVDGTYYNKSFSYKNL